MSGYCYQTGTGVCSSGELEWTPLWESPCYDPCFTAGSIWCQICNMGCYHDGSCVVVVSADGTVSTIGAGESVTLPDGGTVITPDGVSNVAPGDTISVPGDEGTPPTPGVGGGTTAGATVTDLTTCGWKDPVTGGYRIWGIWARGYFVNGTTEFRIVPPDDIATDCPSIGHCKWYLSEVIIDEQTGLVTQAIPVFLSTGAAPAQAYGWQENVNISWPYDTWTVSNGEFVGSRDGSVEPLRTEFKDLTYGIYVFPDFNTICTDTDASGNPQDPSPGDETDLCLGWETGGGRTIAELEGDGHIFCTIPKTIIGVRFGFGHYPVVATQTPNVTHEFVIWKPPAYQTGGLQVGIRATFPEYWVDGTPYIIPGSDGEPGYNTLFEYEDSVAEHTDITTYLIQRIGTLVKFYSIPGTANDGLIDYSQATLLWTSDVPMLTGTTFITAQLYATGDQIMFAGLEDWTSFIGDGGNGDPDTNGGGAGGDSRTELEPLTGEGVGSDTGAYGDNVAIVSLEPLTTLTSTGVRDNGSMTSLEPLVSVGGDYAYSESAAHLEPLTADAGVGDASGHSFMLPLIAWGSDHNTGESSTTLQPLTTKIQEVADAQPYAIGRGIMVPMIAYGYGMTEVFGRATVSTEALQSWGSDYAYANSTVSMRPLNSISFGAPVADNVSRWRDNLVVRDTAIAYVNSRLFEWIHTSDTAAALRVRYATVNDGVAFYESIIRSVLASAIDGIKASDVGTARLLVSLRDFMQTTDQASLRYYMDVAEEIHLLDFAARKLVEALADGTILEDSVRGGVQLVLMDTVFLSDTWETLRRALLQLTDTALVDDDPSATRSRIASLFDAVLLGGGLVIDGEAYNAWVVNTESLGLSRYEGYNFNSVAGDLGARSDGLYVIDGLTDAGTPISAWLETGLMDFGTALKKQVPDVYLGLTADGRTLLKVSTSQDGRLVEDWYEATLVYEAPDNMRYQVGRGLKARYWKFRLENVNGADFDLDNMEVRTVVLTRRL